MPFVLSRLLWQVEPQRKPMQSSEHDAATPMTRPLRRLDLNGVVNFRDLGGYAVADGRKTRWGKIFRSDSLADLSDEDMARIGLLQLRSIFDLRAPHESSSRPNRIDAQWQVRTHAIGFYPHGAEELMARVKKRDISPEAVSETFKQMYSRLPIDQAPNYSRLLQELVAPGALPALIHCTSGKDRTGFGVAVVLLALGVERDTIMTDYALTNQFRRDLTFMVGEGADPAIVQLVQGADPQYLGAAFDTLARTWGSEQAYLRDGLGFSAEQQARLQALLLE